MSSAEASARHLTLGDLLRAIRAAHDGFDLLHHRKPGELHHDVVSRGEAWSTSVSNRRFEMQRRTRDE